MLVALGDIWKLVVKLLTFSTMPSFWASSVVKSAGTGPSSAVSVRGAGWVRTVISCSARCSGAIPTPSTDGTTVTVPPDTSNRASFAPLPKALRSSPMAVCSAAGSMATARVPSSLGVKVSDAAMAPTGTSAVVPSEPLMVTGADSAGVTVSSRTRWASALSTWTFAASTGSLIGVLVATGREGRGDRGGRALLVQGPTVGRVDHARRGAVDRDRGVDRGAVHLLGDGLDLRIERRPVAGDDRIDLAVPEQARQPGPGVQRPVVSGVDRAGDVQREICPPGGARGGDGVG